MKGQRKNKNFLPYGHQWISKEDIKAVVEVLESEWLTQGQRVEEFEKTLSNYCGARYALAVSCGTAGLHLAYLAAGLEPGDEVITTPLTFAATSNMLVHCGVKPVFAEIQEDTLNIDPAEVAKKISRKTKAIVCVDFAGQPCDLDELKKIAENHHLLLIEDAAHSLGSEYKGKKVGGIADLTIFSFHPVKLITSGEGGAVLTNRKDLHQQMKVLRHHGIVKKPGHGGWYYEIEKPGFNYRLTDFQCALGISQLKKIDKFIRRRREIVEQYNDALKDIKEIIVPGERGYVRSSWHIYPLQFRLKRLRLSRKKLFDLLQGQGLGVQVHYLPLHLHPFYQKKFGYKLGDFPIAERYYERAITLPLFPKMHNEDVVKVTKAVKKIISSYALNYEMPKKYKLSEGRGRQRPHKKK